MAVWSLFLLAALLLLSSKSSVCLRGETLTKKMGRLQRHRPFHCSVRGGDTAKGVELSALTRGGRSFFRRSFSRRQWQGCHVKSNILLSEGLSLPLSRPDLSENASRVVARYYWQPLTLPLLSQKTRSEKRFQPPPPAMWQRSSPCKFVGRVFFFFPSGSNPTRCVMNDLAASQGCVGSEDRCRHTYRLPCIQQEVAFWPLLNRISGDSTLTPRQAATLP